MTKPQRIKLMAELWPAAADGIGCSRNDRERRIEEISKALGRPVDSANDIGGNKEFDAVKLHLLGLARNPNLKAMTETIEMERTRLLVGIRERRDAYGLARFTTLVSERFGVVDWESLPNAELEKLRNTLEARINSAAKRSAELMAVAVSDDGNPDWTV